MPLSCGIRGAGASPSGSSPEERAVQDHRAFVRQPFIMVRERFAGHHAAKEEGAWRRYWCSAWGIC